MISKEMLKRCGNELKQAFCALPDDVQEAIEINSKHAIYLGCDNKWIKRTNQDASFKGWEHLAFRLSPDTPTEPEWVERSVVDGCSGYIGCTAPVSNCFDRLSDMVCHINFLGIIYRKDGIETLRTSIDAAFGVPVRVRFSKP